MKKWKIIIFVLILLFSIYKVIDSKNLDIKDNVYIVSQSDVHEKESISNNISDENDNQEKEKIKVENINKKTITVFISGEVKNPGVVTIDAEKRLSDAVNELGGTTENADLNKVNLAMKLKDESHYIIPKIGDNLESYNSETFENDIENDLNNKNNLINKQSTKSSLTFNTTDKIKIILIIMENISDLVTLKGGACVQPYFIWLPNAK